MSRKIDGNLIKSGPVLSLPLRRNHEKQSRIRGRKHMLYVVFPPRFNIFLFRFHLRNQVISSCERGTQKYRFCGDWLLLIAKKATYFNKVTFLTRLIHRTLICKFSTLSLPALFLCSRTQAYPSRPPIWIWFIVKLFYSNHIFLPSCALTLKIQMVFVSPCYLLMYFTTGRLKSRHQKSEGNTRNGNLHMKTWRNHN